MMKLIKKHAGGGWIDQARGIWDYSDSKDPDIQKKIAQYYAGLGNTEEEDNQQAQNYLKSHKKLADYLDTVYKYGVDWDKQKDLGNVPTSKYLTYRNSKGEYSFTKKGNIRESYAKSLGYADYRDLINTLKKAGYRSDAVGGVVTTSNSDSEGAMWPAVDSRGKFYFADEQGKRRQIKSKSAMQPIVKRHQDYLASQAKKAALHSSASTNWAALGDLLGVWGHFYDKMIEAGYKYDPSQGTYSKGNDIYYIDDLLQVSKASKANPNQKVIVQKLKFFD